ncbi:MAG: hypothetical protein V1888_00465 [archaeon]
MKKFVLIIGLILMIGIVAAHYEPNYKEKFSETKIISKTVTFVDYDNDKRFSTYDYRNGYSYRATQDYFCRKYAGEKCDVNVYKKREVRNYDEDKRYSYEYVPYLRSYEKRECYVSPPRDKLFYVKC